MHPVRRSTHEVRIGSVTIGGNNPVAVQSMTNVPTLDTAACVRQVAAVRAAGGRIVRLTAQGPREAENLREIAGQLRRAGMADVALVADIHFRPDVALIAARYVDKVRINPGNYRDPGGELFRELLAVCRDRRVALRIGVNHGSLSPRIVERWGDTPEGMVESAMEFLRVCRGEGFDQAVVSMKSSNVRVMVAAYRLLVRQMDREGMTFPLHLGVTEAGDGMEGRVKSAVGIGSLLAEGIGDTIRVSLTEPPENEIPVGLMLADYFAAIRTDGDWYARGAGAGPGIAGYIDMCSKPDIIGTAGGESGVRRRATGETSGKTHTSGSSAESTSDDSGKGGGAVIPGGAGSSAESAPGESCPQVVPAQRLTDRVGNIGGGGTPLLYGELDAGALNGIRSGAVMVPESPQDTDVPAGYYWERQIWTGAAGRPVLLAREYTLTDAERFFVRAAADFGMPLLDGLADAVRLRNSVSLEWPAGEPVSEDRVALAIMQAARVRISHTEYIACPGCGRTQYDLQGTLAEIRRRTNHLKGLKIGVMGCIVNGPGEMADADYGYVGEGAGRVSLYKGRQLVRRAVPEQDAVEALVGIIKENGDWQEP